MGIMTAAQCFTCEPSHCAVLIKYVKVRSIGSSCELFRRIDGGRARARARERRARASESESASESERESEREREKERERERENMEFYS